MPLPFILAGVAAVTAGYGAKKGYDGYQKKSQADDIIEGAEQKYNHAKTRLDTADKSVNKGLTNLGNLQLGIGSNFAQFKSIADELLSTIESASSKDISVNIPKHRLDKVVDVSISATTYMAQVAGAGVTGAAAAYAVYGGVMALAAASTGTPIAALSGAAAYNATLATIGGGSLATGGLGMAGGTAVLGGLVVAPVIAVAGFAYDKYAEKSLDNAHSYRNEAQAAISKINISVDYLNNLSLYISKIETSLNSIYTVFQRYFNDLKTMDVLIRNGADLNLVETALINVVENGYLVAAIIADIISTPLFKVKKDSDGNPELKDGSVQVEVDENNQQIINEAEITENIDVALESVKKYQ